ncbi:MAG: hypothetical protein ACW990_02685 [Promethearchaeota archaeon]|jgi:hypothetical protein
MAVLNFLNLSNVVIIYSSLFISSITIYYSPVINVFLWEFSLVSGFVGLILTSLIYTFLKEYKKIPDFPFVYFVLLLGILIGSFFISDSVTMNIDNPLLKVPPFFIFDQSTISYTYNLITGLIIVIFISSILIYYFITSYNIFMKARSKETVKGIINLTLFLSIPLLMHIFYFLYNIPIFRELHILLLWLSILALCIILLRKPEMFFELTNMIYYINIYHKSGVLLYSYHFDKTQNKIDSAIWGNILIGLNHILSEFVDTQDQIDVLQTKNTDIIVNYDDVGFAVVLITNRKNKILTNLIENFTLDFKNKYSKELLEIQDINKLINVAEFKETSELIEKEFYLYL